MIVAHRALAFKRNSQLKRHEEAFWKKVGKNLESVSAVVASALKKELPKNQTFVFIGI